MSLYFSGAWNSYRCSYKVSASGLGACLINVKLNLRYNSLFQLNSLWSWFWASLKQCGHCFILLLNPRGCALTFLEYIRCGEWEEDLAFSGLSFPAGKGECREFSPRMDLGQRWPLHVWGQSFYLHHCITLNLHRKRCGLVDLQHHRVACGRGLPDSRHVLE